MLMTIGGGQMGIKLATTYLCW